MSKANAEQLLAIEHQGGVLLRAGAGSGKTFVLVEHILHLTRGWMREHKSAPQGGFEDFIRGKFSQVVMMTFTKKAAGEMSIRLTEKFAAVAESAEEDREHWRLANEALPLLTVTTIDGFCRRLITLGHFPHLSSEAKVIFTAERLDQVREILDRWFRERSGLAPAELLDIVIREKRALLTAFGHVFSDPGLRLSWRHFSLSSTHPDALSDLLERSFTLNDLDSSLAAIENLELPHETERSSFEKFIGDVQATGLPRVSDVDKLNLYSTLFAPVKVLPYERGKKKTPAHEAAKEGLAALRDWVRNWQQVTTDYRESYETKVLPWIRLCQELFHWIEERLDPNQGMTFGDIEYYVALGLELPECRERIQKDFRYFIVDEFQDTSALQFQIIRGLIGSDFRRLFCVGDAKQAIYGFRGGELSVFRDCGDLVPTVRSLANNYRSLPGIINFNNSLFRAILPLGQGFSGHDPFSVDPEDQRVPEEVGFAEPGQVEVLALELNRNLEEEGKFSTEEINRLEANLIADSIQESRAQSPEEVCTVLYSKLRPSAELIRALMKRNVGFTAQFKIDLLDDPVLGIFLCLLRRRFDSNVRTRDKYPLFLLGSYLKILGAEREVTELELQNFDRDANYWGLTEAFRKFYFRLSLTNENSDLNLGVIENLAAIYHQDPEAIMVQLSGGDNDRVSLDFRCGDRAHMVQIMTAHASKGLEFDSVYLGGVYTNGKDNSDGAMFGDLPGSFSWYQDLGLREKKKSPFYVYEDELSAYKSFSEAKRLFYVAATRAKKRLLWVELGLPEKSFSIPKNSWIDGLRVWMTREGNGVRLIHVPPEKQGEILSADSAPELPLFFYDSMGLHSKGESAAELGILSELSVTRLNSLLDCPRKFYLENVLKLTAGTKPFAYSSEDEEADEVPISSADRGTLIHAQIAKGIDRNFIVPREIFGTEDEGPVKWALDQLRDLATNYELVAEKQLKFSFFNFMISGIPDLVLYPKSECGAQVWDFKTGRITQENLSHYWLQLSVYAYALFELGHSQKGEELTLALCFVDERKILTKSIRWEECAHSLYPIWRSQNEPWRTNPDHCGRCPYGDICPR